MAIASLALGIGGLTILPLLGSIVAVVLGYMARRDIRSRPHEVGGSGIAMVGLVLGWIGIGLAVLGLVCGGVTLCWLSAVGTGY
jgi:predicted acyltransferase